MKKHLILLLHLAMFIPSVINAQFTIPYGNSFDKPGDTLGWRHYAVNGTDDWAMGKPAKTNFNASNTSPNAWVTNLSGNCAKSSERILETPYFNLKDTSKKLALSFFQKKDYFGGSIFFYLEYSINKGNTWQLLNDVNAKKKNWQGSSGFFGSSTTFQNSVLSIRFLQGKDSVKFRYRFISNTNNSEGWIIDDFSIMEEAFNFYALPAEPIRLSKKCDNFTVKTSLGFYNQYTDFIKNTTDYYFSRDSILDLSDTLLGSKVTTTQGSVGTWNMTFNLLPNLYAGKYFIIFKHDAPNTLKEIFETDNMGFAVMQIDSVYSFPYSENFESNREPWRPYTEQASTKLVWQQGAGTRHHTEGAHSGTSAWHTGKSIEFDYASCGSLCYHQYVQSPYFDMTSDTGYTGTMNIWYKTFIEANALYMEYSIDCGTSWSNLFYFTDGRNDDWDYINKEIPWLAAYDNVAFRIVFTSSYVKPEGLVFDDFYIGQPLPDLSIERDLSDRYTSTASTVDTLRYFINNSGFGNAPQSTTAFYWSADSIFDGTDVLLGNHTENAVFDTTGRWTSFTYTKLNTNPGKYFIFYKLDKSSSINEMREYNNSGYFTIHQYKAMTLPYFNDFETQVKDWRHNATLGKDDWQWSRPKGKWKDNPFSGNKSWISKDSGNISRMSRMHLYTPLYDLRNTVHPVLEFDMIAHIDGSCNCDFGKMNMSYSTDGGATWKVLDTTSQSFNRWYYPMEYEAGRDKHYYIPNYSELLFQKAENAFAGVNQYNSRDAKRNTKYIIDLSFLAGSQQVQFRYNLAASFDENKLSPDTMVRGSMIDNFSISEGIIDLLVDYKKTLMISSKAKQVKFYMSIKNQGNYYAKTSVAKFYLSTNTTLDGSDYYLGQTSVPVVRPDMYQYINLALTAPVTLSSYKYLVYELDADKTYTESSETNNTGYWNLALDSVFNLPYFNGFSDTIQHGWHQFSIGPYHSNIGDYRFRNLLSPAEVLYQTAIHSEEFFTDRMLSGSWNTNPYVYLETPGFNFEGTDGARLSFDLMCTGSNADGGNMHYSIDGGNTWTVLDTFLGKGYKWYNIAQKTDLDNEPGWSKPMGYQGLSKADSTSIDLAFLKGKKDVRFRFKYKSNVEPLGGGSPQGMRIDNFRVEALGIDYIKSDSFTLKSVLIGQPTIKLDYDIITKGTLEGGTTLTKFYWSKDSILDSGDTLILTEQEAKIKAGTVLSASADITVPNVNFQNIHYVFYVLDAGNALNETNENNNTGSFRIRFINNVNYVATVQWDTVHAWLAHSSFNAKYRIKNKGNIAGKASETAFFWSADSLLDGGDQKIKTLNENAVNANDSISSSVNIIYPTPVSQAAYFLFYQADNRDSISETDESDNIGVLKILFDYKTGITTILSSPARFYSNGKDVFIRVPGEQSSQTFQMIIYNNLGQMILTGEKTLEPGITQVSLPAHLASGIYCIMLENAQTRLSGKFYIE